MEGRPGREGETLLLEREWKLKVPGSGDVVTSSVVSLILSAKHAINANPDRHPQTAVPADTDGPTLLRCSIGVESSFDIALGPDCRCEASARLDRGRRWIVVTHPDMGVLSLGTKDKRVHQAWFAELCCRIGIGVGSDAAGKRGRGASAATGASAAGAAAKGKKGKPGVGTDRCPVCNTKTAWCTCGTRRQTLSLTGSGASCPTKPRTDRIRPRKHDNSPRSLPEPQQKQKEKQRGPTVADSAAVVKQGFDVQDAAGAGRHVAVTVTVPDAQLLKDLGLSADEFVGTSAPAPAPALSPALATPDRAAASAPLAAAPLPTGSTTGIRPRTQTLTGLSADLDLDLDADQVTLRRPDPVGPLAPDTAVGRSNTTPRGADAGATPVAAAPTPPPEAAIEFGKPLSFGERMKLEMQQKRERAGNGDPLPPENERTKPMSFGERMQLEMKLKQSEHEDQSPERSAKPLSFGERMKLEMQQTQQKQRPNGGSVTAPAVAEEGSDTEEGAMDAPTKKEARRATVFDLEFGPVDDGFAVSDEAEVEALPDSAFMPVVSLPTPVELDPAAAAEAGVEIDGLFDFLG